MLTLFLLGSALAGTLVLDAKVPTELRSEGSQLVQIYVPGEVRLELGSGIIDLIVFRNGNPETVRVEIPEEGEARLIVGKAGVSAPAPSEAAATPREVAPETNVEFRTVGSIAVMVQLDQKRIRVSPGTPHTLTLPTGTHAIKVRSSDGTVIWAQGNLDLGGHDTVVQLTEGRGPEVSGKDARWSTTRH